MNSEQNIEIMDSEESLIIPDEKFNYNDETYVIENIIP